VVMLTGDREKRQRSVAAQLQIEEIKAEVRPEEKARSSRVARRRPRCCDGGDGINDALHGGCGRGHCDGHGTDVAIENAVSLC